MSREGALWIGGLEPYMDESFLMNSFRIMGEHNVLSIKVFKQNFLTSAVSYGFVNFTSDHAALLAMHKLNGNIIPNTNPPVRYKLNHNSTRANPGDKDLAVWVGDLSPDVQDYEMYNFFSSRFKSTRSAKVVLSASGESRGYGFVRFSSPEDQTAALATMNGATGLGRNAIRVNTAQSKGQNNSSHSSHTNTSAVAPSAANSSSMSYEAQWQQYYAQLAVWNAHYGGAYQAAAAPQYGSTMPAHATSAAPPQVAQAAAVTATAVPQAVTVPGQPCDEWGIRASIFNGKNADTTHLVDHANRESVESQNEKYIKTSNDLFDAVDESRWQEVI